MPEHITAELTDRVLTITLNRPDRLNAWTQTMFGELMQAFDRADADDEVRAVIVTGARRGATHAAHLRVDQACDRSYQRSRGGHRRHHDPADGCAPGGRRRPHRVRV